MRSVLLAFLCTGLLLGIVACKEEEDAAAPSSDETETTIPFDREGTLAILQNGDSVVTLDIEIAETDSARERGMMQREGFPNETSGMLFVFDQAEERRFWMANTPVALDLLFIDADSQIVTISKYARPNSPDPIPSEEPAQYVLETPAGFSDQFGVLEGDRVRWRRTE